MCFQLQMVTPVHLSLCTTLTPLADRTHTSRSGLVWSSLFSKWKKACKLNSLMYQAILGVGEVLQFYDNDRRFPAWGFGAKTPQGYISHCFNLNATTNDCEVRFMVDELFFYTLVLCPPPFLQYDIRHSLPLNLLDSCLVCFTIFQ